MDFSSLMIRCSAIGIIMAEPKEARKLSPAQLMDLDKWQIRRDGVGKPLSDEINKKLDSYIQRRDNPKPASLSLGCKSHLLEMYALEKYGKRILSKESKIKYTAKGNMVEEDAIKILAEYDNKNYFKNDLRLSNGYISGHLDVFEGESIDKATRVIDVKAPWDLFSFLGNVSKPLNSRYWWQMQGYLALTTAPVGEICYVLVNTPESLVLSEQYHLLKDSNVATIENPTYMAEAERIKNDMTFDDIPISQRILRFKVEKDDEAIQKVYEHVDLCREWLTEFDKKHENNEFDVSCIKYIQNEEDNS